MQSTGAQKQIEQCISDNSIQAVFLLLLFTVLQCGTMPINEIDSRPPGTKVPQQLSKTACQFSWGLPGCEPDVTPLVAAVASRPWGLLTVKIGAYPVLEWGSLRKRMAGRCSHWRTVHLIHRYPHSTLELSLRRWEPWLEMRWMELHEKFW